MKKLIGKEIESDKRMLANMKNTQSEENMIKFLQLVNYRI